MSKTLAEVAVFEKVMAKST